MSVRFWQLGALVLTGILRSGLCEEPGAEVFSPEMPVVDHYEFVWKRSPFVRETTIVDNSQSLAQRYSLAGLSKINNEFYAVLIERGNPGAPRIWIPNDKQPIQLVSVTMDRDIRKSTAVIQLGAERASLTFDNSVLNAVNAPGQMASNMVNGGPGSIARPSQPGLRNPALPTSGAAMPSTPSNSAPSVPVPPVTVPRPMTPNVQRTQPTQSGSGDTDAAPTPSQRFLRRPPINTTK